MSLRALKGRGNPPLRAKRGNLNLFLRDRTACSEQSEGIFFALRDDTGIIAFVLIIDVLSYFDKRNIKYFSCQN